MAWAVILAYVCFGLGGVLIIIGLVRVTYYGCAVRRDKKQRKKIQDYYNFNSHNTDPWLKSNPLVTNRLEVSHVENDSLKDVDVQRFDKDADSLTESQQGDLPRTTERDVEHVYHSFPNQSIVYGGQTRLDSETLSRNAHYEEPNTNLVLAKKHQQPDNLEEILSEPTPTTTSPHEPQSHPQTQVEEQEIVVGIEDDPQEDYDQPSPSNENHITHNHNHHKHDLRLQLDSSAGKNDNSSSSPAPVGVVMNGEPMSARSLDTREAFEALDFATSGETMYTPRSENLGVLDEKDESELYGEGKSSSNTGTTTPSTTPSAYFTKFARIDEPLPARDELEYKYEHAITSF